MRRRSRPRSATEPTTVVNGDARTSSPTTSTPSSPSTRINASPRWPELPVTRMRMHGDLSEPVVAHLLDLGHDGRLLAAFRAVTRERLEGAEARQRRRAVALQDRQVDERALVETERRVAKPLGGGRAQLLVDGAHELHVLGDAAGLHAIAGDHGAYLRHPPPLRRPRRRARVAAASPPARRAARSP